MTDSRQPIIEEQAPGSSSAAAPRVIESPAAPEDVSVATPPTSRSATPQPSVGNGKPHSPASEHSPAAHPVFNRRDQRVLFILGIVFFVIIGARWVMMTRRPEPLPWQRGEAFDRLFRVDVNSATWIEWNQLEGIGPGYAHRIVADRQVNGPFASIDDVTRVPGIGASTLDRIRPWLTISHESGSLNAAVRDSRSDTEPDDHRRSSTE
ncbi:MAG: helix-hairpin-helix domain-containing protein [Planctomycetaceae bacterium]